ncbi:hypothetical protein DEO72_LG1g2478 [Vigna unguiculata]|uniref:PPC domain-containing protein n=1 Tax=Vigna unguiculata TaxID=3917 RepID=A0A4D6KMS8_VIGUN|nr:hypothetical protein DEO72_LG1g2478 [Vigna unguiculata]
MTNRSMPEFFSQNFLSANSDSKSFGGHQIGSSSHSPPPTRLIMVKVDSGCDIIESILDVARQNETSLAIKSACGTIASMTLCNITDVPVTMNLPLREVLLTPEPSMYCYRLAVSTLSPGAISFHFIDSPSRNSRLLLNASQPHRTSSDPQLTLNPERPRLNCRLAASSAPPGGASVLEIPRIIKIESTDSRRLAEIHHCQAVPQRTQKHSNSIASPGSTGLHRQVVHQVTQNTHNLVYFQPCKTFRKPSLLTFKLVLQANPKIKKRKYM